MFSQCFEPFFHSVDLEVVFSLSVAFINESLCPFSVASCDLFDSNEWVRFVISLKGSVFAFI